MEIDLSGLAGVKIGLVESKRGLKQQALFRGPPEILLPITCDPATGDLIFSIDPHSGSSTLTAVRSYIDNVDVRNHGTSITNLRHPYNNSSTTPQLSVECDYQGTSSSVPEPVISCLIGQKEIFTVTAGTDPSATSTLSSGSTNVGTITYDNAGNITWVGVSGFGITAGGVSQSFVTLENLTTGEIYPDIQVSDGPGGCVTNVQGTNDTPAIAEVWTVTVGPNDGVVSTQQGGVIYSVGGVIQTVLNPINANIVAGGVGYASVTFEAAPGAYTDDTIGTDGTGGASLVINVQGADLVPGFKEQFTYSTGGPTSSVNEISVGGATFHMTSRNGVIISIGTPTGFAVSAGATVNVDSYATFTANANGPVTDAALVSGECSVVTIQDGC
jgi:hypothetical protein